LAGKGQNGKDKRMAQGDTGLTVLTDLRGAFGLLTRLPLGGPGRGAASTWAWPVVGAAVGAMGAGAGLAAQAAGVPLGVAAALVIAVQAALTGMLHEDGLADTFDGLLGGRDPAQRLEIMRDSRIGAFGALALVLAILMRWSAIVVLLAMPFAVLTVLAAAALSRAGMAGVMAALPPAREGGLSRLVGRPSGGQAGFALLVALVLALPGAGWALVWVLPALAIALGALALWAKARIGGQTGDILGASQQIGEIVILSALAASLS
jgi:adenosylcobinamide-GDP ribazoletransferase